MNTSEAAHKPSDLEAQFQGQTRTADGYQYWTTSEEDEESLDIRDQVAAGTYESKEQKAPRRKILEPGAIRRTGVRVAAIILISVLVAIVYLIVTYVQVTGASGDDDRQEADVAIVLGAAQFNGAPSNVLQERLDHAFNLYTDQYVDHIFVTGGGAEGDTTTESRVGLEHLLAKGVPADDITEIPEGANSWEQLAASAAEIQNLQLDNALLVSDGYHNYRLLAIADELGLEAYVSPSVIEGTFVDDLRESVAVSIGRITGYERLSELTEGG